MTRPIPHPRPLFALSPYPSLPLPNWGIWVLLTFLRPDTCLLSLGLAVVVVVDCVTILHRSIFLHVLFNLLFFSFLLFWFICLVFVTSFIIHFFLKKKKKESVRRDGCLETHQKSRRLSAPNCTGALANVRTISNCPAACTNIYSDGIYYVNCTCMYGYLIVIVIFNLGRYLYSFIICVEWLIHPRLTWNHQRNPTDRESDCNTKRELRTVYAAATNSYYRNIQKHFFLNCSIYLFVYKTYKNT